MVSARRRHEAAADKHEARARPAYAKDHVMRVFRRVSLKEDFISDLETKRAARRSFSYWNVALKQKHISVDADWNKACRFHSLTLNRLFQEVSAAMDQKIQTKKTWEDHDFWEWGADTHWWTVASYMQQFLKQIMYAVKNQKNIRLSVTSQTNKLSKHSEVICLSVTSTARLILKLTHRTLSKTKVYETNLTPYVCTDFTKLRHMWILTFMKPLLCVLLFVKLVAFDTSPAVVFTHVTHSLKSSLNSVWKFHLGLRQHVYKLLKRNTLTGLKVVWRKIKRWKNPVVLVARMNMESTTTEMTET